MTAKPDLAASDEPLWGVKKVAEYYNLSVVRVRHRAADPDDPFPAPKKTGRQSVGWEPSECRAHRANLPYALKKEKGAA